jgi:hypothetical protein
MNGFLERRVIRDSGRNGPVYLPKSWSASSFGGPISDRRCNGPNSNRDAAKSEALNEACRIDREVLRTSQSLDQASAIFDSRARVRRPLVFTSVNVQFCSVGRPGLDPGTLGLKGTFHRLFCVGLVAHVYCFQGIVLF